MQRHLAFFSIMKKNSLTNKQFLVPFVLITSLFFLWGFARAILDVLNKHFQNALDISITQSSLIQVTTYLGYFLTAIPAGWFINRHGYRLGVVIGLMLFGIGSLLFIPCAALNTFYAFLGAWRQGNGNKSPQLLAVVQRLGLSVRNTCRGTVFLRWSF